MNWLLLALRLFSIPAALTIFALGTGNAQLIDGQYVLTSHGEIIGSISQHAYILREICSGMVFPCILLPVSLDVALQCRAAFLLRRQ